MCLLTQGLTFETLFQEVVVTVDSLLLFSVAEKLAKGAFVWVFSSKEKERLQATDPSSVAFCFVCK